MPLLICAALWYLVVTSILMVGQYYLERYYARGSPRQLPPTPLQKLRMRLPDAAVVRGRTSPRATVAGRCTDARRRGRG